MASVAFDHVTKRFGDTVAVDDLDLRIEDREFLVLLGPSGCGKSTALRMIAGLEELTSGSIHIGDHRVDGVDPKDRDLAMVFQSYALYPHKSVRQNIEFPLRSRKVPAEERAKLVDEAADQLGLSALLDRKPRELSGGQRQRVALARAIVRRPAVFLMDEPLSNLDAKMRTATRAELVELHERLGTTFVYVTHDQVEAMTMATRVAVMSEGRLQQVGAPQEVYDRPANVFVAQFIGSPPMNVLPGDGHLVGIRPEHLTFADAGIAATVRVVESLGHERHVVCDADGHPVIVRTPSHVEGPAEGDAVHLHADPRHVHRFDPASGERLD
jgi:ABC-type sugar transport system ATPase subunit